MDVTRWDGGREDEREKEVCFLSIISTTSAERPLKTALHTLLNLYACFSLYIWVCTCVSSFTFKGLGFIFAYTGSPILIKFRPIRVSYSA